MKTKQFRRKRADGTLADGSMTASLRKLLEEEYKTIVRNTEIDGIDPKEPISQLVQELKDLGAGRLTIDEIRKNRSLEGVTSYYEEKQILQKMAKANKNKVKKKKDTSGLLTNPMLGPLAPLPFPSGEAINSAIVSDDYRGQSLQEDFIKLQKENEKLKTQLAIIQNESISDKINRWLKKTTDQLLLTFADIAVSIVSFLQGPRS